MRKPVTLTAAIVAAVLLLVFVDAARPARSRRRGTVDDRAVPPDDRRRVPRSQHAIGRHRRRSTAIAAAAARAGLRFVVLTDHGDAIAHAGSAAVSSTAFCVIDAVEISTNQGHVVALDLPAAPYPLGGEARGRRRGRRCGWADSRSRRIRTRRSRARAGTRRTPPSTASSGSTSTASGATSRGPGSSGPRSTISFGPGPALASLLDRPAATLARWDAHDERRPVVAVAGHDAHGGISEG